MFKILVQLAIIVTVCICYKLIVCNFAQSSSNAEFICEVNWKDGFIFLCCYSIVKLLSPFLSFDSIRKRIVITTGLYCITYGIIAFPYLIASFFQPLIINVFLHVFAIVIAIEILFDFIFLGNNKSRQNHLK